MTREEVKRSIMLGAKWEYDMGGSAMQMANHLPHDMVDVDEVIKAYAELLEPYAPVVIRSSE